MERIVYNFWEVGVNEEGGVDVHFEAFQLSDQSVKEGRFLDTHLDIKTTRLKKHVVILGKDTKSDDNDFFLVLLPHPNGS